MARERPTPPCPMPPAPTPPPPRPGRPTPGLRATERPPRRCTSSCATTPPRPSTSRIRPSGPCRGVGRLSGRRTPVSTATAAARVAPCAARRWTWRWPSRPAPPGPGTGRGLHWALHPMVSPGLNLECEQPEAVGPGALQVRVTYSLSKVEDMPPESRIGPAIALALDFQHPPRGGGAGGALTARVNRRILSYVKSPLALVFLLLLGLRGERRLPCPDRAGPGRSCAGRGGHHNFPIPPDLVPTIEQAQERDAEIYLLDKSRRSAPTSCSTSPAAGPRTARLPHLPGRGRVEGRRRPSRCRSTRGTRPPTSPTRSTSRPTPSRASRCCRRLSRPRRRCRR